MPIWRDGWAGLRRTIGNRVNANTVPRVRIPLSPPQKEIAPNGVLSFFVLPRSRIRTCIEERSVPGEQQEKDTVCPFLVVKEPKREWAEPSNAGDSSRHATRVGNPSLSAKKEKHPWGCFFRFGREYNGIRTQWENSPVECFWTVTEEFFKTLHIN